MIKIFGIELNKEELFIGACIQFPMIFLVGWWVLAIMPISALLWSLGGAHDGHKLFRRLGVTFLTCVATFLIYHDLRIFIAMPFMIWLAPSYGADSSLFKYFFNSVGGDHKKADILTRNTTYFFYWLAFGVVLFICR